MRAFGGRTSGAADQQASWSATEGRIPIPATETVKLEQAQAWLSGQLSVERLEHSIGVCEKAAALAEGYNFSREEREAATIAGLLHDAAKLMRPPDLLSYCERHDLALDEMERKAPQTLHPLVGAELVRQAFGLEDPDILNAIRYHTTARPGMSRVEKVVYIADKIEEKTRNPEFIREMTVDLDFHKPGSMDLTMLRLLNSTIRFLMERNQLIHPRTLAARNAIIEPLRTNGHL